MASWRALAAAAVALALATACSPAGASGVFGEPAPPVTATGTLTGPSSITASVKLAYYPNGEPTAINTFRLTVDAKNSAKITAVYLFNNTNDKPVVQIFPKNPAPPVVEETDPAKVIQIRWDSRSTSADQATAIQGTCVSPCTLEWTFTRAEVVPWSEYADVTDDGGMRALTLAMYWAFHVNGMMLDRISVKVVTSSGSLDGPVLCTSLGSLKCPVLSGGVIGRRMLH
ncbi:hypothetical protein HXX76_000677 [Chlamydomonas incerta]|uniref:Uncharacterized protein n=1 Tax=Chlamydomonas incerta TaxID=51695 RepID=A0A836B2Z8_CHLIN|nr:hypothetical protein HXX76_000677 [Chlamydomonas incerta]|eukprot:KAG2446077.1 hypothetical protein HXX76_000677 [Chlamydomonas incerta]